MELYKKILKHYRQEFFTVQFPQLYTLYIHIVPCTVAGDVETEGSGVPTSGAGVTERETSPLRARDGPAGTILSHRGER